MKILDSEDKEIGYWWGNATGGGRFFNDQFLRLSMSTAGFVAEGATLYYETSDCSGTAYDFGGYDYFANGLQVVSLTEAYYPARPFATRTVNSRRIIGGWGGRVPNTRTRIRMVLQSALTSAALALFLRFGLSPERARLSGATS